MVYALTLLGLIPACAGKTQGWNGLQLPPRAHPRVCGENQVHLQKVHAGTGSSPRVRGKPQLTVKDSQLWRLIPACAGKTLNDLEF